MTRRDGLHQIPSRVGTGFDRFTSDSEPEPCLPASINPNGWRRELWRCIFTEYSRDHGVPGARHRSGQTCGQTQEEQEVVRRNETKRTVGSGVKELAHSQLHAAST